MRPIPYCPPWAIRQGLPMTLYTALWASRSWEKTLAEPEPDYHPHIFSGAGGVPLYGLVAIPDRPKATLVGTYGITGNLENQWYLKLLGRKAVAQGFAVVLFDWRAHGKTAELSPTLTSDGLYEGEDFVHIAAIAKDLGCPAPFWFTGFSLGGQLALWGIKAGQSPPDTLRLAEADIGGGAVICPSLDSVRSLTYLTTHPFGRRLEQSITQQLKQLAWQLHTYYPEAIDRAAIERVDSIWAFDRELVIGRLGFPSVEAYYKASSPLPLLPQLTKPTLILYAADDPLFDPTLVSDLKAACTGNTAIDLMLTPHGGHVGYFSSKAGQRQAQDPDPWWAWNRILEWINYQCHSL
ncbi:MULTISPECIES: alpha/beta fold hydrolase [unclassified Leptolyngbya]|uniref:YheT family hydrolase n=1 Tax=unclassified Leptolyngbya TaxID=2650499 RepID=UPI0016856D13|nr:MULTISPECIES: alpha/beta fold hydrolase [unclassified Leptolyngbya]MBD1912632.1 alpha/beta fold hydrolase [Leptolyngbya sp. FACHB-8]MBD2156802.1 alpha/beta fold hydrolase [Leptolyngbya sp. FACHB-16]